MRYIFLLFVFVCHQSVNLHGQIVYANDTDGNIWEIDLDGCSTTFVANMTAFNDMAIDADGTIYGLFGNSIYVYDPISGNQTLLASIVGVFTALEIGQDGLIYAVGFDVVSVNPANGATNNLGTLPNGWLAQGDVTFLNGIYYLIVGNGGGFELIDLNLNDPSQSVVIDNPPIGAIGLAGVNNPDCPKVYMFQAGPPSAIYEYDVNTGQTQFLCNIPYSIGGADTPNGYTFNGILCPGCVTMAGTFGATSYALCEGEDVSLAYNNDAVLDADDTQGFIVVADTTPPWQPISYLTSPNLMYDEDLFDTNTVYYVANVAGNELPNGQVSFADTCFDRSNFISVLWRPLPAVTLSTGNPDVCPGECMDVTANFTGTPPFSLTYTAPGLGSVTQSFPGTTGTFQVCVPPNAPQGGFMVEATALADGFCTCD